MSGQTKRFIFYCVVLLVAVSGVVLGLDWTSAPMRPMPETKNLVFVAPPPPPPPAPVVVKQTEQRDQPTPPPQPARAAEPAAVAPPPQPAPPPQIAAEPPPPKCDIDACSRAYRSFTESDCTYQPSDGPRRLCTKGVPPAEASGAAPSAPAADNGMPTSLKCNVNACSRAYRSFTESDCTYQPSDGPRRLCEK